MSDSSEPRLYKIGEAASILNLKSYVLRFWESEFPQLIPSRTEKGQRMYTEEHIALLRHIRHLLHDKGLTIEGARKILNEEGARGLPDLPPAPEPTGKTEARMPSGLELGLKLYAGAEPEAKVDAVAEEEVTLTDQESIPYPATPLLSSPAQAPTPPLAHPEPAGQPAPEQTAALDLMRQKALALTKTLGSMARELESIQRLLRD